MFTLFIIFLACTIIGLCWFGTGVFGDARRYNTLEHIKSMLKGDLPMSYTRFKRYRQFIASCEQDYWFLDNDWDIMNQGYLACHPCDLQTLATHFDMCLGNIPYEDIED